jgi:hypothetical protein
MLSRTTALATLVAALAVTGCGGDDGPTAEEYAAQGNVACTTAAEKERALKRPTEDSAEAVSAYAKQVTPIVETRLAALRGLEPPDDLQRFHDRLIQEQETLAAAIETVGEAAGRNDRTTTQRASQEGAGARARSALLYKRLGLTACAGSPF